MSKKITKQIFSIFLILCMLVGAVGVMPVSVFATGEAKIIPSATDGAYEESSNTLTVTGGGVALYWFVFKKKK